MKLSCRRLPGFTLMELLLVIGILAILAAILFPVINSSKRESKLTGCLNNQKQIAAAVLQYTDDYQGKLPCGVLGTKKGILTWDTQIIKHLKNKGVFKCPDDPTKGNRSYGYNDQAFRHKQDFGHTTMMLAHINPASKYIVITDYHNDANKIGSPSYAMSYFAPAKADQYHNGKTENNYAYFDGHVQCKKFGTVTNASFFFEVDE